MKILYIHQYFRTPAEGGGTRSYHLARGLVESGHEVVMVTAHDKPYEVELLEGIDVRRLPIAYDNSFGFARRILAFLKFAQRAKEEAKKVKNVDLAYVMTTPLTTGIVALWLKQKHGVPYYFEVGDLWPEAPIQMGVVKNRLIKNLLYGFEKKCYDQSTKVIALSPEIKTYIKEKSPKATIAELPNLSHCDFFQANYRSVPVSEEAPLHIGYIGTFGKANHLEYLLDVAKYCQGQPVKFHLKGKGAEGQRLRDMASGMTNVTFYNHGSEAEVKSLIDQVDAVYVSFLNVPALSTGSPNKFFDGLAAGKLIIINFGGWIKDLVEQMDCGFYHDPQSPQMFLENLLPYLASNASLRDAQKNARALAEREFDRKKLVKRLVDEIAKA